ncbi:hypothetical protein RND71_032613 [Anisodus tanguticus]|uniref:Uncharacterized protein n=1 Tax=Anisodus tanguticus TaxID=243964 RepID=A0AAE1R678_9SOLA|nr:hypothetical protein RND71_032613 [Anisodus tanguticus]
MVKVKHCSYSTLMELESLSKLTVLTLFLYSGDVMYNNLGLSSKLTRYYLKVGEEGISYVDSSVMDKYNRIMNLEITESIPLGDWIRCLLRKSEFVHSSRNGSKNVLTELLLDGFQNVKDLRLNFCDSLTCLLKIHCQNIISFPQLEGLLSGSSSKLVDSTDGKMVQAIKFPNLYHLEFLNLECFTHFCSDTVEGIEFPRLRLMRLQYLNKFQNFWPTANNSITDSNPLFDEKVCFYCSTCDIS